MAHHMLIKNGLLVDGTGTPARRADVAITGGKIAEIGRETDGAATVIDAADHVVAPGFIDPHTHYDAQICWDSAVTPSSWHGVTSVIMGNCGVGIAPRKSVLVALGDGGAHSTCYVTRATRPTCSAPGCASARR